MRTASLATLAFLGCSLAAPAHAAGKLPPEPGTWWDITMKVSPRGANVPRELQGKPHVETQRECLPKKIPDRAPPQSDDCTISDYRRSGPRVTFKLKCQDGVTGEAELRWTSDTYSGTTVMRGPGLENRIELTGKKVGGDCDANAKEREEAEGKAAQPGEADAGAQEANPGR